MKTILLRSTFVGLFATVLFSRLSVNAQYIWVNVSFKIVLNSVDGHRPTGASDAAIQSCVSRMNELLDSYERGYRLRLVDPISAVGGIGQITGPSQWFGVDFFSNGSARDDMESAAKN